MTLRLHSNYVQHSLTSIVLVLLVAIASRSVDAQESVRKTKLDSAPNIIVFLVDDMGWQDTSVPFAEFKTPQNRHFKTPNMMRLAKSGVCFTNAYAHAICSPTRTSIMTGQSTARHHVTNWTLNKGQDTSGTWGPVGSPKTWDRDGLQPKASNLASVLSAAGYQTIHCGKAHWGAIGTAGSDPRNLGFDVNIGGHSAGAPGSYQSKEKFGNHKNKKGKPSPWAVPGLEEFYDQDIHLTDALTIKAKQAIDSAAKAKKPFFLYMAHYAVHTPIQAHKRFVGNYQNKNYVNTAIDIPAAEEKYASMVEGMDDSLGQLMDHLEKIGQAENTIVIFTSDNGGLSVLARSTTARGTGRDTHNWPLRAGKGSAYEGGTRVPYIVSWLKPNTASSIQKTIPLKPGTRSVQPLISEDLYPTIVHVAQASKNIPKDHVVDGLNCVPFWTQSTLSLNRPILFHYPHVWGPKAPGSGYVPHSSLRAGQWKVIYFYNDQRWELYDLKEDIGEKNNLASKNRSKLFQMATKLLQALNANDVQWPVDRESQTEQRPQVPAN